MRPATIAVALSLAVLLGAAPAFAQTGGTTTVSVRALAAGAKLIGDVVGGARITITDVETGGTLASGITRGGTGDTGRIMNPSREPGAVVYATPGAAEYRATFELDGPTEVEIAAEGPLDHPDATARSVRRLLLLPGTDLSGEGIVLELHGLIVEILEPEAAAPAAGALPVRARVRMLCSCPTEPGGLWSVQRVAARLLAGAEPVAEVPLEFAGEASLYSGTITPPGPGEYTLEVIAADPANANFGVARRTLVAR